jgi:hypothetical protein
MARAGAQAAIEKAAGLISMSAFGGKADMGGRIAAIVSAAFDP